MIKTCCNDANGESKDYADGICSDPADLACEVCMPTHVDPVISALAMVANFDEQDLNNEESLTDQEPTFQPSQEHLWQSPIIHKLLTSTSLDDKCLNDLKMFEEEITFSTSADDDYLEFTSEDDIFLEDALCVAFSTSLFPHHNQDPIEDVFQGSTLSAEIYDTESPSSHIAGMSSTPLPDCFHQVPNWILYEKDVKHLDWLQFHLPVLYQIVESPLQDIQGMHPCQPLYAMITICQELKVTHVRPRGYIFPLLDPDAENFVSTLMTFVDSSRESSAAGENVSWFLPPSRNVALPSLQLSSKLLTQDLLEALPTRDDWSYVVAGFAPEDYFHVSSATTSYPSPLSKKLKTRCVENKIFGDGPKSTKSLSSSYFQDALAKIDISQFFTSMGSKTWSIAQLEILRFTKSLTLLIAIYGDVASFPYDRGKMDLDYFLSTLTCMQLLCQFHQDFVKQDLCICLYLHGESLKKVALMWSLLWFYCLWGVTDMSMGSDSIQELYFAQAFPSIASSQYPDPAWMWIT